MEESGISKTELARMLEVDEKKVRRLLDPGHSSKSQGMEQALLALGKRVVLSLRPAIAVAAAAAARRKKPPNVSAGKRATKGMHPSPRKRVPVAA